MSMRHQFRALCGPQQLFLAAHSSARLSPVRAREPMVLSFMRQAAGMRQPLVSPTAAWGQGRNRAG